MKVSWTQLGTRPSHGLVVKPDNSLDGVPLMTKLILDMGVSQLSRDKRVVAAALAFEAFIAAELGGEEPTSRLVADAVRDFFAPRKVVVPDVTDIAEKAWPTGGVLHVVQGDETVAGVDYSYLTPHESVLRLYDNAHSMGAYSSVRETRVSTNLFVMHRLNPVQFKLPGLILAAALLLSDDLHCRAIRYVGSGEESDLMRYASLLRSTGVNLLW